MSQQVEFDEENTKRYYLEQISNKLLAYAAYRLGIEEELFLHPSKITKKVDEWKEEFLSWPLEKFKEKLMSYYMSDRITTHLYLLDDVSRKHISDLREENRLKRLVRGIFGFLIAVVAALFIFFIPLPYWTTVFLAIPLYLGFNGLLMYLFRFCAGNAMKNKYNLN
ncbi:MAG: hypothetical protein GF308_19260 [Candidatus Heimdallarchaeota archaeon]|nr:hypothetical protein [Candidatus Heimdallarchaeota archaeon]